MTTHTRCDVGSQPEVNAPVSNGSELPMGCVFCSGALPTTKMIDLNENDKIRCLLAETTGAVVSTEDRTKSSNLCLSCVVNLNMLKENQHNTKHNFKYWRDRSTTILTPASSSATAATVSQKERSLSSSESRKNGEMATITTNGRTISPPLLAPLYSMARDMIDTESGGAFEKVQAKHRQRSQAQMCPYCNKAYQREAYLRKHIRKLHSGSLRTKTAKSMYELPLRHQNQPDVESNVVQCKGCFKNCAPNEWFHYLTCKMLQTQNEVGKEDNGRAKPARRQTRSMSRAALIPEEEDQSVVSLPTRIIPTTKQKRQYNVRKPLVQRNEWVPPSFECEILSCSKYFPTLAKCVMHEHEFHRMMLTYQCRDCGDWFTSEKRMLQHVKINHKQGRICVLCGATFTYRSELEEHLRYHPWGSAFECLLCRRHFFDARSLVEHRLERHNYKPNPKPIRILDRLGDPMPREIAYVPILYVTSELVHENPKHVERLPRTVGLPIRARHIRKRNAFMRGLRKPSGNAWDRCVANDWIPNDWRNGRLWSNDLIRRNIFRDWKKDFIDGTDRVNVSEEDVWWRRQCTDTGIENVSHMQEVLVEEYEASADHSSSDTSRLDNAVYHDSTLSYSPELFAHPIIFNSREQQSETIRHATIRPKSRVKLRQLYKRRLIAMPWLEPGPCLPSFDNVLHDIGR